MLRFLGKTYSVFGKNMLRFWGEQAPFLGKTGSVFGTKWFRFGEKVARFGESWLGFRIGLRQSSSVTVLNVEHVWVGILEVLGLGVSKNKSTGRRVNC